MNVVGHENDVGALYAFAECFRAFLTKTLVAYSCQIVDKVEIKVECEAGCKGEPGPHAGRIGIDRHVQVFAQLGELLHIVEHAARPRPIDSGDKRDVLAAGKSTVKGAAEAKRKRHPGISPDNPKSGISDPAINRINVDLPAPLTPRTPKFWPESKVTLTLSSTVLRPL